MVTAAAARRELEDLRAAINHHRREGLCSEIVSVALPPRTEARERWLTRSEAARPAVGRVARQASHARQATPERAVGRHVARFILVGLYTGTRSCCDLWGGIACQRSAAGMSISSRGVFYRRAIGRRADQKASAAGEATDAPSGSPAALAAARARPQGGGRVERQAGRERAQGVRDGCTRGRARCRGDPAHPASYLLRPG